MTSWEVPIESSTAACSQYFRFAILRRASCVWRCPCCALDRCWLLTDYAMEEHDLFREGGDGRRRSNTWPLPDPSAFVNTNSEGDSSSPAKPPQQQQQLSVIEPSPAKKNSRKNAWGNMSYAELITQAIQSSEDKRMTLSQIYDWMVNSISYFRDKGDSNSSAGWKVCSIFGDILSFLGTSSICVCFQFQFRRF